MPCSGIPTYTSKLSQSHLYIEVPSVEIGGGGGGGKVIRRLFCPMGTPPYPPTCKQIPCISYLHVHINVPYNIIAGKFGGELNFVLWQYALKLPN